MKIPLLITAAAACVVLGATVPVAHATVLVEDYFSHFGGVSGNGYGDVFSSSPDGNYTGQPVDTTSPAGAIWQGVGQADGYDTNEFTSSAVGVQFTSGNVSQANIYNRNGGAMTLGGSGATALQIAMTFAQIGGSNNIYLGFYSAVPTTTYASVVDAHFTGFAIDSTGTLYTDVNGALSTGVAFGGTYTIGDLYTLSYSFDTTTGTFSNVTLSSSSADYSGFSAVGAMNANYAGFAVGDGSRAAATHFIVSTAAIPEPASLGLLALGGVALLRRRH